MKSSDSQSKIITQTLIDGEVLREARNQGINLLYIPPKSLITPLARDLSQDFHITLKEISPIQKEETQNNVVSLGSDHGGFALKEVLKKAILEWKYEVMDVGPVSEQAVDYPDFAYQVSSLVAQGKAWRGIMIDGVGIGSCMVANKLAGIRAAHCRDLFEIKNSRAHNNANVLCLGGQILGIGLAKEMTKVWLEEPFEGGRHARRVDKIDALDHGQPPI